MHPTLRSVLASPTLRRGQPEVLSGGDRLDASVRWVHVGEVRDIANLLQGQELVLTTGLAMRDDAAGYVRSLVSAGAAGLVVELGPQLPTVPTDAVAAARSARFPLVALHRTIRFVEVTEEVHREIVAEQLAQLEFAREVHERFTRLSLGSAPATEIVAATAELCGSSVVLEDLGRRVVAFTAAGRPAGSLLADWERRSRAAATTDEPTVTGAEGWVAAPVGLPGRRWGRLVVPDPQTSQARLTMLLERAAQALELGRMVERDRLGLQLQAQGGLLTELAAGRVEDGRTASARARALGLPDAPLFVPVVAIGSRDIVGTGPTTGAGGFADVGAPEVEHEGGRELVEHVATAARDAHLDVLVGPIGAAQVGVLVAVPARGRQRPDEDAALEALTERLGAGFTLGVGPGAPSVLRAGAGLPQAAHLAEVAAAMPTGMRRRYHRSTDVRLHGLVALLHDDPRLQAYVEAQLGQLLAHDAARGDGLLDLLRSYVEAGGNKTRLAAAAHRSRAAVYKRLARLEQVLGVDLDDPLTVMSLGVAVLAHDHAHR